MRDYDPTTGRYLQADPLGLAEGASVYGYARQNPGRYTDPRGLFTLGDARASLANRGAPMAGSMQSGLGPVPMYSDHQVFSEWMELEEANTAWTDELLSCPCRLEDGSTNQWFPPTYHPSGVPFHPGGFYDRRSFPTPGGSGTQCIYDAAGGLLLSPPGAGSADFFAFNGIWNELLSGGGHYFHDVEPFLLATKLGSGAVGDYYKVRPVK